MSPLFLCSEPELAALTQAESLIVRVRDDYQIRPEEAREGKNPSRWAVMARRIAHIGPLATDRRWRHPATRPGLTPTVRDHWLIDSDPVRSQRGACIFWKFSGRTSRLVDVARAPV